WDAYLNFLNGHETGTIVDITTSYQLTEVLKLGLNAADFAATGNDAGGYRGGALYAQYGLTDALALGVRGEYFKTKDAGSGATLVEGDSVMGLTLSANVKAGPLTVIPEFRLDSDSKAVFFKNRDLDP